LALIELLGGPISTQHPGEPINADPLAMARTYAEVMRVEKIG